MAGKLREQTRCANLDGDGQSDGYYLPPPVAQDINLNRLMQLTTEALRSRLKEVGLRDPWMLDRSDIYEQAINNFGIILDKAPLPNFLREAASFEITLLANSLLNLFTGSVRPHATALIDVKATFSGDFEHLDGRTKRVFVKQWLKRTYLQKFRRVMQPNCQIYIGENSDRAIEDNNPKLRCGLSFGGWFSRVPDNRWCISIDSGITTFRGNHRPLLESLGPITKAFNECRKYPESFYYLQDDDSPDTFHFGDPATYKPSARVGASQFITFNNYLNKVFREIVRA